MPKLSRPVVYTFVAAVAAYAAFLLSQPDAPTARHSVRVVTAARPVADADGITAADLNAHFPRYAVGTRDPFVPRVVPPKPPGGGGMGLGGARDAWALTGIYTINDTLNALVENRTTGESLSLKPGARWRGLRVLSIGDNSVVFENALGQHTKLAFAQPADEGPRPNAAGGKFSLPALRVVSPVGPLRPMPIIGPLPPLPSAAQPPH